MTCISFSVMVKWSSRYCITALAPLPPLPPRKPDQLSVEFLYVRNFLRELGRVSAMAERKPRNGEGADCRVLQSGYGQTKHDLVGIGGPGALLRLDRRHSQVD